MQLNKKNILKQKKSLFSKYFYLSDHMYNSYVNGLRKGLSIIHLFGNDWSSSVYQLSAGSLIRPPAIGNAPQRQVLSNLGRKNISLTL